MRRFDELDERELLALAIANEEEDGRIYADFAEHLREHYPDSARLFDDMVAEEDEHRRSLLTSMSSGSGGTSPTSPAATCAARQTHRARAR